MPSIILTVFLALAVFATGCSEGSKTSEKPAVDTSKPDEPETPLEPGVPSAPTAVMILGTPVETGILRAHTTIAVGTPSEYALVHAWIVNGQVLLLENTAELTGADFNKGDKVEVEVWLENQGVRGPAIRSTPLTIRNTPPAAKSVVITGGPPYYAGSPLVAQAAASDVDGDQITFTYSWRVNFVEIPGVDGSELAAAFFTKNSLVTVTATPHDGTESGASVTSDGAHIFNAPPAVTAVTLSPSEVYNLTPIEAKAYVHDSDDTSLLVTYNWFVDGVWVPWQSSFLPASYFSKGQTVQVEAVVFDGWEYSAPFTAGPILVRNSPPTAAVALSYGPYPSNRDISAYLAATWDDDDDTVTGSFQWYVDGVSTGVTGPTLPATYFARGQTVFTEARPFDGAEYGPAVRSNSVEIENSPPMIATVLLAGPVTAGAALSIAQIVAGDHDGDLIGFTYSWFVDEVPVGIHTQTFAAGSALKGKTVKVRVQPYDLYEVGLPVFSNAVTIQNTAPRVTGLSFGSGLFDTESVLSLAPATYDADGDLVTLRYEWRVNGEQRGGNTSSLDPAETQRNDVVWAVVTPFDGTDYGDAVSVPAVRIGNALPRIAGVTLAPGPVTTGGTVSVASVTGTTDPDGDPVSLTYAWRVNGTVVLEGANSSLDGAFFEKGDVITVEVTPGDGSAQGTAVTSGALTVANAPPAMTGAAFAPGPFTVGTDITVSTYTGVSDADGDEVVFFCYWTVDGVQVGTTTSYSSHQCHPWEKGNVLKHSTVEVRVVPYDGEAYGAPVFTDVITVQNSLPSVWAVSLGNGPFRVNNALLLNPVAYDPDMDAVSLHYAWRVNGVAAGADAPSLASSEFSVGDWVWVVVTPFDGEGYGSAVSAPAVLIRNPPPSIESVTLSPGPVTTAGTVTIASIDGWSDPDGEAPAYRYRWFVNGALVVGQTGSSLSGNYFSKGQVVSVEVTPTDGIDDGSPVSSAGLTIANTPPVAKSVSLVSAGSRYAANLAIQGLVTVSDIDGDTLTSFFRWYVDGVLTGHMGATLPAGSAAYGQSVTAELRVFDGEAYSNALQSPAVVLVNALPEAPAVTLYPAVPTEGAAHMYAEYGGPALDADGDPVTYSYLWEKDGAFYASGVTLVNGPFGGRDTWKVTVTPNDGKEPGAPGMAVGLIHEKAVAVAAGYTFSCWVAGSGNVRCSGLNNDGVIGLPADGKSYITPQKVGGFPAPVSQIVTGEYHACALLRPGTVYCWGDNGFEQLGHPAGVVENSHVPLLVAGAEGGVELAAGEVHTCVRKADGTVWCWGHDVFGELGDSTEQWSSEVPRQVGNLTEAVAIGAGSQRSCAVQADGKVKCWGRNSYCALGQPAEIAQLDTATEIAGSAGLGVLQVVPGHGAICMRTLAGAVYCVGHGLYLGSETSQSCNTTPALVTAFPSGAVDLAGKGTYRCALRIDGTVTCWDGYEDGSYKVSLRHYSPGFTTISRSQGALCGLAAGGEARCLLDNTYGQHGAPGGYTETPRNVIGFGGY